VLREVEEVGRTIVVDCDVDAREFVEAHIMITNCGDYRHKITESGCQSAIHAEKIVPSICTGWHVIIISYIASHEKHVWLESCCNLS